MNNSDLADSGKRANEVGTAPGPTNPSSLADLPTRDYRAAGDPEGTTDAIVPLVGFPPMAGACHLEAEIGRGGMGVVLRARDPFFGRKLAVKVLQARAEERPDLARRFLDEARLTGRLQHPGIPPVHEQGTLDDCRPYFTMKLIEGRTLDALLKKRGSPLDDLPRFVTIFGQVCQTVAYAHCQGVIHRDLKPANVMVGAFGEVQVMDWGLAKDRRTNTGTEGEPQALVNGEEGVTQAGQAVGTPSYMPPEQARGEVAGLDERADVFGLGAILCAMLTGRGPYQGSSVLEVLRQARQAALADAEKRLESCGADAELITLARICLSPERTARPRDAGVVAAAVARYQEGVQERLRKADVERAAAQARAQAERGKRRLTLALAGTVLAVAIIGGGVWVWLQQQYQVRLKQTVDQANQALGKALTLRGQAAAISLLDVVRWREAEALRKEALTAGEQAEQIVTGGEADSETRRSVGELLPQLRAEAESTTRDRAMLDQLHAIRFVANDAVTDDDFDRYLVLRGNEDRFIYSQVAGASEYIKAFREYGVDVEKLAVVEAAAAIGTSRIQGELTAALEDWLRLTDPGPRRDQLLQIARLVDPDLVRDRLRLALSRGDGADLQELAASPAAVRLPVSSVLLLAEGLFQKNRVAPAITLLRQAQRLHADDFWLNNKLGEYLMYTGGTTPPQMEEAMRFFTAALVIRPRSVTARVNLADALAYIGAHEEAEAAYRQALEDQPTLAYVRNKLAAALAANGRYADALEESRRAVELRSQSAFVHEGHGGVLFMIGRYEDAVAAYRKAISIRPEIGSYHSGLGQALTELGQTPEALKAHGEAARLKPSGQTYANLANTLVKCGRIPDALEAARTGLRLQPGSPAARSSLANALAAASRHAEAVDQYREAIALTPRDSGLWWRLGNVLRNQGKNEEAAATIREAIRRGPQQGPRLATMDNELGLILSDLGQPDQAIAAFRKAAELKPDDAIILENLGDTLRDQGCLQEAGDVFRESVRLKPDWSDPRRKLAEILERQGRIDDAAAVLAEASPSNFEALYRRVRLYQDHGRHREALELLEARLKVNPSDSVARHHQGISLEAEGRLGEAVAAFERSLTGPSSLKLDYARASLDFGGALLEQSRRLENEGQRDEARIMAARPGLPGLGIEQAGQKDNGPPGHRAGRAARADRAEIPSTPGRLPQGNAPGGSSGGLVYLAGVGAGEPRRLPENGRVVPRTGAPDRGVDGLCHDPRPQSAGHAGPPQRGPIAHGAGSIRRGPGTFQERRRHGGANSLSAADGPGSRPVADHRRGCSPARRGPSRSRGTVSEPGQSESRRPLLHRGGPAQTAQAWHEGNPPGGPGSGLCQLRPSHPDQPDRNGPQGSPRSRPGLAPQRSGGDDEDPGERWPCGGALRSCDTRPLATRKGPGRHSRPGAVAGTSRHRTTPVGFLLGRGGSHAATRSTQNPLTIPPDREKPSDEMRYRRYLVSSEAHLPFQRARR